MKKTQTVISSALTSKPVRKPKLGRVKTFPIVVAAPYYGKEKVWNIYPSSKDWKYGQPPLLGMVRADNEYWAKYAAYDAGLVPRNDTFDIVAELSSLDNSPNGDVRAKNQY